MKKLSTSQIEKLYAFTRQHYVPYYDLQTELVDHLSNGIETQWEENETLSFDEALQCEFKKFGVFGFTDLVEKRQKAMNKKYTKLVFRILKEYFSLPKILLTLFLCVVVYVLLMLIPYRAEFILSFSFGLMIVFLALVYIRRNNLEKRKSHGEKLWLFEEIINSYGSFLGFSFLIPQVLNYLIGGNNRLEWVLNTNVGLLVSATLIAVFLLLAYVLIWVIPTKAKCYIAQEHPEYNLID